jgi:glycosyltransferase involved in cell wall biosynthesis
MRFSVDAHAIGCHLTGNEVYIRNLLKQFARIDRDNEFIAYVSKPGAPEQLPSRIETRWVSTNPYKRLGFDIPRLVRTDRPDLLHVQYTGPVFSSVPVVTSVHDVSYLEFPKYFTPFRAWQLRHTVKRTVNAAACVLTPSEFSRNAILRHYAIDESKVVVVHNAVSNHFRPIERDVARAFVQRTMLQRKMGLTAPYVLTVGDLQPRKNHLGLLRAFEDVMRAYPQLPHHLLFVGKETWYSKELHAAVMKSGIADRVHFTGFVEDDELVHFYAGCDLFVFPSFYEGFGLPILEAMACGRAVACSNSSAMPEVADSAALLFDPHSTQGIGQAIKDILLDGELRARLERLGSQRAAAFSWEQAAEKTLNAYYRVAGGSARATGRPVHAEKALNARMS